MARTTTSSTPQASPLARAVWWLSLAVFVIGTNILVTRAFAQPAQGADAPTLSAADLGELVGPIALYPDDLIAIILPASTYPLQVVQAARFLDEQAKNPDAKPPADWDDSVVALLNYPEVLQRMNDDIDWTWRLGEAVLGQRGDVLGAIQTFRDQAYAAGNLRSDDHQVVTDDDGTITIAPANPEVVYIPYYEPARVLVYQSVPVFSYYPWGYPLYDYPYPANYVFNTGFFWGVTTAFIIGWHTHLLHVYHHDYYAHPYYGRRYHEPWYVRRDVNVAVSRGGYVWQPNYRRAARPFVDRDGQRVVGSLPPGGDTGRRYDRAGHHYEGQVARGVGANASRQRVANNGPVTGQRTNGQTAYRGTSQSRPGGKGRASEQPPRAPTSRSSDLQARAGRGMASSSTRTGTGQSSHSRTSSRFAAPPATRTAPVQRYRSSTPGPTASGRSSSIRLAPPRSSSVQPHSIAPNRSSGVRTYSTTPRRSSNVRTYSPPQGRASSSSRSQPAPRRSSSSAFAGSRTGSASSGHARATSGGYRSAPAARSGSGRSYGGGRSGNSGRGRTKLR